MAKCVLYFVTMDFTQLSPNKQCVEQEELNEQGNGLTGISNVSVRTFITIDFFSECVV